MTGEQAMGIKRNQREQAQPEGGGTGDGFGRPLPLGFKAQLFPNVVKSRFHLPTTHQAGQAIFWAQRQVGRE